MVFNTNSFFYKETLHLIKMIPFPFLKKMTNQIKKVDLINKIIIKKLIHEYFIKKYHR